MNHVTTIQEWRLILLVGAVLTLARLSQCAVKRRRSSVGAKPTRQLSLQPVAIRSGDGGNEITEASGVEGRHGRLGEHAGRNESER